MPGVSAPKLHPSPGVGDTAQAPDFPKDPSLRPEMDPNVTGTGCSKRLTLGRILWGLITPPLRKVKEATAPGPTVRLSYLYRRS